MKLADVSIDRPVFATMMIFALVVLGLFSYMKLNIDQFPDVDIPLRHHRPRCCGGPDRNRSRPM
jgi:hypothetical protein